jgi:hypothetical protein
MLVLGVFVIARLVNKDSQGETLAGRLIGGQPSSSSTSNQLAPYAPASGSGAASTYTTGAAKVMASQATGIAARTHSPAFASDVLKSLGAPATPANISSLTTWFSREGNQPGVDQYNPLDTTLAEPGAKSTNSAGVKSYTSWAQGVTATAQTLAGGGYSAIVAALKSGAGIKNQAGVSSELERWSGHGYGSL